MAKPSGLGCVVPREMTKSRPEACNPTAKRRGILTVFAWNGRVAARAYDPPTELAGKHELSAFFEEAIDQLHAERRYRVFADLERIVGAFPRAIWRGRRRERPRKSPSGAPTTISAWGSTRT
jgi:hypothetical protein